MMKSVTLSPKRIILLLSSLVAFMASANGWPVSQESNIFDMTDVPVPVCTTIASASGVSNPFDLMDTVSPYFSFESNIFSLQGRESGINLTIAVSYSSLTQAANISAYAYDKNLGTIVSSGSGSYRVSASGITTTSGSMTYSSTERLWKSGPISITGSGTFLFGVTINGYTAYKQLNIAAGPPVHLTGKAMTDSGTGISGGTVKLYNSATVFSAANLQSLPAPLDNRTTLGDGTFDFGDVDVGQYVLVLITGNGTTVDNAFWLVNGEGTHYEEIIENPGRTDLLNMIASFKEALRTQVLQHQTTLYMDIADSVDEDLDGNPKLRDWALFIGNMMSGTAAGMSALPVAERTSGALAGSAAYQSTKKLLELGLKTEIAWSAEGLGFVEAASVLPRSLSAYPFEQYRQSPSESSGLSCISTDISLLIDPLNTKPYAKPVFDRSVQAHSSVSGRNFQWYENLTSYRFAEDWLDQYYTLTTQNLPELPANFSRDRARRAIESLKRQLSEIKAGTSQIFIGLDPQEASISGHSEPIPLGLRESYDRYKNGQAKMDVWGKASEGSTVVGIGANCVVAATIGASSSGYGAVVPAVAKAVSLAANGVGWTATAFKAGAREDMTVTYVLMSGKYCANLVSTPLALGRVCAFIEAEAADPYYMDITRKFGSQIDSIDLGGTLIGGAEVFFPESLQFLFSPPVQLTPETISEVNVRNPSGNDPARIRVETKVINRSWWSGKTWVHDQVVVDAGLLNASQSATIRVPFRDFMAANMLLSKGTFEVRTWNGPFQATRAITKDFYVMPRNLRVGVPTGALSAEQEEKVVAALRAPLAFIQSANEPMSGEDLLVAADRVRERVETNLVIGANSFTREYAFPTNIFGAEFRLYRPVGASVSFRVEKDGEYIGRDETTGDIHQGFPGDYSGNEANPEIITVPNIGGQTVTVQVAMDSVEVEDVNVLLEAWEQPVRNAVMAVLPDEVSSISRAGVTHVIEMAIGESSHQHPLESVSFVASPLQSTEGTVLNWSNISWAGTTNIPAAGLKTCSMELDTTGVADGTYTGTVTVSSVNAGVVSVPVSITVDGQAPQVDILPLREWWFNSSGPAMAWTGVDNLTAQNNLLYTYTLEPLDGSWSGYCQTTNRDLSDVPDGDYILSVAARDQALNETAIPADAVIRIDRTGEIWKQRIVDADPNDGITNIGQVVWDEDFDGDGASNLMEYYAGTDPINPGDLFVCTASTSTPSGFVIRWAAKRGVSYQVRRTTNLVSGTWEDAPAGAGVDQKSAMTSSADGEQIYRDATATNGSFFYKIETRE